MLLDLFHIKINDDSYDLLFDNHFISLDTKHVQIRAKIGNNVSEFTHSNWVINLIIQVLNIKSPLPRYLIQSFHFCTQ